MRVLNIITLLLVIIGGLNWGLVGLFNLDLVASIFGGAQTTIARAVYILVGISAVYQLMPLAQSFDSGQVAAERGR